MEKSAQANGKSESDDILSMAKKLLHSFPGMNSKGLQKISEDLVKEQFSERSDASQSVEISDTGDVVRMEVQAYKTVERDSTDADMKASRVATIVASEAFDDCVRAISDENINEDDCVTALSGPVPFPVPFFDKGTCHEACTQSGDNDFNMTNAHCRQCCTETRRVRCQHSLFIQPEGEGAGR